MFLANEFMLSSEMCQELLRTKLSSCFTCDTPLSPNLKQLFNILNGSIVVLFVPIL